MFCDVMIKSFKIDTERANNMFLHTRNYNVIKLCNVFCFLKCKDKISILFTRNSKFIDA